MSKANQRKVLKRILLVGLAIYMLAFITRIVTSSIDFARVDSGAKPLFALETWLLADGGTIDYEGFGYRLTRRQRIHEKDGQLGYMYGPILRYKWNIVFFPLPNRENLRFVPD